MLSFDAYKKLASSTSLNPYEKVGFKSVHRELKEKNIFPDLIKKLTLLSKPNITILDIGCGCSLPVLNLINNSERYAQKVILVDSEEMLQNVPESSHVTKFPHQFPRDKDFLNRFNNSVDLIIIYSLIHAIHEFQNVYTFIDSAVSLLRERGSTLLIGDISNHSKKQRFLTSSFGTKFHKEWSNSDSNPDPKIFEPYDELDDSVIFQLLLRYRLQGFETYLLPQSDDLPLNNTREDILIVKN